MSNPLDRFSGRMLAAAPLWLSWIAAHDERDRDRLRSDPHANKAFTAGVVLGMAEYARQTTSGKETTDAD